MSSQRQRLTGVASYAATPGDESLERPPHKTTVVLGIAAACLLFVVVTLFLLYRSMVHSEPSHVAIVKGSEPWVGTELVLSGGSLPQECIAVLDSSGRYSVPFFVGPGSYTLVVRKDAKDVYRTEFQLGEPRSIYIELPKQVPATAPATQP